MQNLSPDESEARLSKMTSLWNDQREVEGPNGEQHMFHVEFGHFSNFESFEVFEKFAVRNADSLGMNEVEMKMILDYWSWQEANEAAKKSGNAEIPRFDLNADSATQPNINVVVQETQQLFRQSKAKGLPMSRAHLHPHGFFLICYDNTKWADAYEAIIKSAMVIPKYCARQGAEYNDWAALTEILEIPPLPEYFELNGQKNLYGPKLAQL